MNYYHKPTQQVVDESAVQAITGVNPQLACEDTLASVGIFHIEDKMERGLLDNPLPVFTVVNNKAVKTNSPEEIPLQQAKIILSVFLKSWVNREVDRLFENSGLSYSCLFLLGDAFPFLHEVLNKAKNVANHTAKVLSSVNDAQTTQEVKQIYLEFQEFITLHGNN